MDLNFDKMVVDTSLAKEHLEREKDLSELFRDYGELIKYVYSGDFNLKGRLYIHIAEKRRCLIKKLNNLGKKLLKEMNLIAELEYFFRNIPIEDTKTQLTIIYKYLRCSTVRCCNLLETKNEKCTLGVNVPIYSETPFLIFGNIMRILVTSGITFTATRATAFVAHLFVKMCRECGLNCVKLEFTDDGSLTKDPRTQEGWDSGTVAVVSEDADIDSAVDKFIAASKLAPWRLKRILVQESVYQQFKDALTWKCNLKQTRDDTVVSNTLCSDTLIYDGKIFLIDPVECLNDQHYSVVTVEAYRTRKEMISMVQKDAAHYLSLWSNGIAEINEVTHSMEVPIVWVNNLAEFRGPPQISLAVYTHMFDDLKIKCSDHLAFRDHAQRWQKLSIERRRIILNDVIDKSERYISTEVAYNIKNSLEDHSIKSFVDVGNDYVCSAMSTSPVGIILVFRDNIFTPKTFKSLLYGNAIIAWRSHDIQDLFVAAGLPIACITEVICDKSGVPVHSVFDCGFRAVWTNSGTIFAN